MYRYICKINGIEYTDEKDFRGKFKDANKQAVISKSFSEPIEKNQKLFINKKVFVPVSNNKNNMTMVIVAVVFILFLMNMFLFLKPTFESPQKKKPNYDGSIQAGTINNISGLSSNIAKSQNNKETREKEFQKKYDTANKYIKEKKYEKAVEILNECISINDKSCEARYTLANCYEKLKMNDEAYREYKKVLFRNHNYLDVESKVSLYENASKQKVKEEKDAVLKETETIDKKYMNAVKLFNSEKYDDALLEFKSLISAKDNNIEAVYYAGKCYEKIGALDDAVTYYKKALSLKSDYLDVNDRIKIIDEKIYNTHIESGIKLKKIEKYSEALSEFNMALSKKNNDVDSIFNIASILEELGKSSEAIEKYKKIIELNPEYIDAYGRLGYLYKKSGMVKEAVDIYLSANLKKPGNISILEKLGEIYDEQNDGAKALDIYIKLYDLTNKSLKYQSKLFNGYYMHGNQNYKNANYNAAISDYKNATDINPNNVQTYYAIGLCYRNLKKNSAAIDSFKKAIQVDPRYIRAYCELGNLYYQEGNSASANVIFQKALEIDPNSSEAKNALDKISAKNTLTSAQNNVNTAQPTQNNVIANVDPFEEILQNAKIQFQHKQYASAAVGFEKSMGRWPNDPEIKYNYYTSKGMANVQDGQYSTALSYLNNALGMDSKNGALIEIIGDCHYANGNDGMAKNLYEEALKCSPPDPGRIKEKIMGLERSNNMVSYNNSNENRQNTQSDDEERKFATDIKKVFIKKLIQSIDR